MNMHAISSSTPFRVVHLLLDFMHTCFRHPTGLLWLNDEQHSITWTLRVGAAHR